MGRRAPIVLGVLAALAVGIAGLVVLLQGDDPAEPAGAAGAADTAGGTEAVESAGGGEDGDEPQSAAGVEEDGIGAGDSTGDTEPACVARETPHLIVTGYFDSLTADPVPEGGVVVGDSFWLVNVVQMIFPVEGGPVYVYGNANALTGDGTTSTSYTGAVESRAVEPTADHYVSYDPASSIITGTLPFEIADLVGGQPTGAAGPASATLDATVSDGVVTGTLVHPDLTLTLTGVAEIEPLDAFDDPACFAAALDEARAEHDADP